MKTNWSNFGIIAASGIAMTAIIYLGINNVKSKREIKFLRAQTALDLVAIKLGEEIIEAKDNTIKKLKLRLNSLHGERKEEA